MISVILYGRNDAHGYNLPKRAAISFNCIAEVLTHPDDELLFVDCNTPDDLPTFPESIADTLTPKARERLRILRVRPAQYEKGRNGTRFKVLEPLCRNVAIRRSNPRNRWILNTNTDMVFVPLAGRSLSDVCTAIADGFYELPRFEMPEILWESTDRLQPQAIIEAFSRWGRRLHLNEKVVNMPEILFDGPGDFQLSLRRQLVAIHGMNEQMVLGWHVDSNLCKRMHLLNGVTRSLLDHVHAYHCDHTRLNTVYHSAGDSTANDYRKFFHEVARPELPEQGETWGLAGETIEEIRLAERTSARFVQVLEQLLPGLDQPMLESALVAESFNHGLLYDPRHVLPYLADHFSTIPPHADIGYLGANPALLELIATFRRSFGHTGRILVDPEVFALAQAPAEDTADRHTPKNGRAPQASSAPALPAGCEAAEAAELHRRAFVVCFDLGMGRFPATKNAAGYSVPAPSHQAGRFAGLIMRRFQAFARREKELLDSGAALTRKFLFIGSQNTWFEAAASQLFNVVLTPFSSYVRHGFIRKDAFTRPFQPVPGDSLLAGTTVQQKLEWLSEALKRPATELDFRLAELRVERAIEARLGDAEGQANRSGNPDSARPNGSGAARPTDLDLELLDFIQLAYEANGRLDYAQEVGRLREDWRALAAAAKGDTASAVATAPAPHPRGKSGRVRVAIDAQTFADADSMARGIGHYASHHTQAVATLEPGWDFVFLGRTPEPPESLQPCLGRPNVHYRALAEAANETFDLFHIPDPMSLIPGMKTPTDLLPGVPATATFHDLIPLRCYIDFWPAPTRRTYLDRLGALRHRGVRLLTNSEFTRRDALRAGLANEATATTIHAGLNTSTEPVAATPQLIRQVRARYGITRPFFLHVGTLDPHKNFQTVIRALGHLGPRSAQLVVVGRKAHYLKEIADHCAAVGMKDVLFTGFIPRADLEVLYADAVALLFLSQYEGFGFPALEAMSRGCPVIASRAASIPEVTGDAALLFHPLDVAGVGQAMQRLLRDQALRLQLRQKGQARAASYTWESTAARTLAVWREMIGAKAAQVSAARGAVPEGAGESPVPASRPIAWLAPWQNPSGYCSEALAFAQGLLAASPAVGRPERSFECVDVARTRSAAFVAGLPDSTRALLQAHLRTATDITGKICVQHMPASAFCPAPGAAWTIGRTMFETDRLPADWVEHCNALDEVWVPTRFNVATFAASGVQRDKLVVIPEAVDETLFDPAHHTPWPVPHRAGFNFLSVFEWSARKGWDVLLAAYLREFSAKDDVCLYLRTHLTNRPEEDAHAVIGSQIAAFAATLGLGDKQLPRVEVLAEQLPLRELPRLYRAVDCLVMPTCGEGWGRPHHEAMMMGLPVIATYWSGPTEFLSAETGYPLEYDLVEITDVEPEFQHYLGHRWARAREEHLRAMMRHVQRHPDEARTKGAAARAHVLEHFSLAPVAARVQRRLAEIERALPHAEAHEPAATQPMAASAAVKGVQATPVSPQVAVAWEGSFLDLGSLSHVNRELTRALQRQSQISVTRVGNPAALNGGSRHPALAAMARELKPGPPAGTQVTVRHAWPPNWTPPASGAWVLIQPWEYGAIPAEWVRHCQRVDAVWVPSECARRMYLDSGVPADRVHVVPNGIDPEMFHPGAPPAPLGTAQTFKFLFVGGTIHRKGPDLLLQAYCETFTRADDVCLVIKDFGGDSAYAGQTFADQIRAAQARPNAPEILYLTDERSDMAGLYTACDCLVHPYRGEGFGLTVLEAMACGLPVIVTAGGPSDEFAPADCVYRVPSQRRSIGREISAMPLAGDGWLLEPDAPMLARQMRHVFDQRAEARARGRAASDYARREWTWDRAAQIAAERLREVASRPTVRSRSATNGGRQAPKTITLPPVARLGHLGAARELHGRKQWVAAWQATLEAIRIRPFHPEAFLVLAEIARDIGDGALARRCAERARLLAPAWKPVRKFLKALPSKGRPSRLALPPAAELDRNPLQTPRLTVCLITRNEEQFLGQCLQSIRALADQIVVVDTGSTDWTRTIAARFDAEVYTCEWRDDFSAARNVALEHARGDWVLILDADEELRREDAELLRRELQAAGVMAYRLPIVDVGRESEGRSFVPRLFRNAPALFYVGRIHEQVFSSVEVRRLEWGLDNRFAESTLLHYGYTAEVTRRRSKVERNLALLERAIEEMPGEPNLLMNYGLELVRAGHSPEGLRRYWEAYEAAVALPAHQLTPELREALLTQLATQLSHAKDPQAVVRVLESPLARRGRLTASMHFTLGLARMELEQFAEAADQFRQCLATRSQPTLTPARGDILKAGPHHCLALALARTGAADTAAQAFRDALAADPQSRPVRLDWAVFLADHGEPVEALHVLHALVGENAQDPTVWILGGQIALSRPEFHEFARDWTGEALKFLPEEPWLVMQRAEALLLGQDIDGALQWWQRLAAPLHPRALAGRILCECLRDLDGTVSLTAEPAVSQEFLNWYRRLVQWQASEVVHAINDKIDALRSVLPTAVRVLEQALLEANRQTAV